MSRRDACAHCRRHFKVKGGELQRFYSSASGRYYCPLSDWRACDRERRKLILAGVIDRSVEATEIAAEVRRRLAN